MTHQEIMRQPRLKVEWAQSHLERLISESDTLPRHLYDLIVSSERSIAALRHPDRYGLTYIPKKPIPEHFGLIIGDVIHNLRSSLDYWTTTVVAKFGTTTRGGRFAMPFGSDVENLKTQRAYKAIEFALPNAARFICDELQTYSAGAGDRLSSISRLNNIDKHNLILPTVAIVGITGFNMRDGMGNRMTNCGFNFDAASPHTPIAADYPITIDENFKTSVEITFQQADLFQNQPVAPTLLNLIEATSQALDRCEQFLIDAFS